MGRPRPGLRRARRRPAAERSWPLETEDGPVAGSAARGPPLRQALGGHGPARVTTRRRPIVFAAFKADYRAGVTIDAGWVSDEKALAGDDSGRWRVRGDQRMQKLRSQWRWPAGHPRPRRRRRRPMHSGDGPPTPPPPPPGAARPLIELFHVRLGCGPARRGPRQSRASGSAAQDRRALERRADRTAERGV